MKTTTTINVIDIESTCWDGDPPKREVSEIIQIGIAEVDVQKCAIMASHNIFVKPCHSKVSPFCTQLTGITDSDLETGISFPEACKTLEKKFFSKDRPWASYGDYDRNMFFRTCNKLGAYPNAPAGRTRTRYPFGQRHLNIKTLIALSMGWPQEVGMDEALHRMGLELVGRHHNGKDDAMNIANILCHVMRRARSTAYPGSLPQAQVE